MKEWIVCEDNCLKCSYGATLDCDGDCPRCPRNTYCPCGKRSPEGRRLKGKECCYAG